MGIGIRGCCYEGTNDCGGVCGDGVSEVLVEPAGVFCPQGSEL